MTRLPLAQSSMCLAGNHCGTCRDPVRGAGLRASAAARYDVPGGADFACHRGHPWGYVPPPAPGAPPPAPRRGPGTELKKLLAGLGLTAMGGCRCDQHAAQMDAWGPDGCQARLAEIVGWLRAEAARLGACFPGFDEVAAVAVQMAIDRARAAAPGRPPAGE